MQVEGPSSSQSGHAAQSIGAPGRPSHVTAGAEAVKGGLEDWGAEMAC